MCIWHLPCAFHVIIILERRVVVCLPCVPAAIIVPLRFPRSFFNIGHGYSVGFPLSGKGTRCRLSMCRGSLQILRVLRAVRVFVHDASEEPQARVAANTDVRFTLTDLEQRCLAALSAH